MAIFATDNEFNILDDPNAGFLDKTPKRPKIWGYLFWIGLFLFAFLLLWNIATSHAQVIISISQQDTNASSTINSSWGQANFDYLYNGSAFTATSTYTSLTLMLGYGGASDLVHGTSLIGKTHRICFYTLTSPPNPGWVGSVPAVATPTPAHLISPIGCLSRTITSNDMATTTPQQKTFTGSVSLPPNNNNTQQPTYWLTSFGIMAANDTDPSEWGNSLHGIKVWGTTNQSLGGAIPQATNGVGIADYGFGIQGAVAAQAGLQNLFFILNGNVPIGGTGGLKIISCEGGGVFDTLLCNLYVSLFVPSDTALNQFSGLWDNIKNKPPFGYFVAISAAMSGIAVGTTTLAFAGISEISIFGTLRIVLMVLLWFLFVFWIFHRLRNFNF